MNIILYLANVIFARGESALGKYVGQKGGSVTAFNLSKALAAALMCGTVSLFFGVRLHGETVPLAVLYGISLALSMYSGLKALTLGNMAIVSMLASFSLIVPTVFGVLFLEEGLTALGLIGIVMLLCSLILLNVRRGGGGMSGVCLAYSLLTMISNGTGSVVQKLHQTLYPGQYRIEFMLFSMATAFLTLLIPSIIKRNKTDKISSPRLSLSFGVISGICNCIANFSILFLALYESASVMFPVLSAMNSIGALAVGRVIFKERLRPLQLASVCLGALSVILLKL